MQTFIRARFYSYMFGKIRFISLRQIWTSNREDGWERNDSFHVGWGFMIIQLTPVGASDLSWDNSGQVCGTATNLKGQSPPYQANPTALLETYCEKTFVLWHNRSSFRDSWISFSRQHHSDRASTLLSSAQCSEKWECPKFGSRPNGIKRLDIT